MKKPIPRDSSAGEQLQPEDLVGPFSLAYVDKDEGSGVTWGIYELELLTAEEKAAYYEDRLRNHGREDAAKIAKDCRKKAGNLRSQARNLDPDEAKPLLRKARMFDALASSYENPCDPEEDEGRRDPFDKEPSGTPSGPTLEEEPFAFVPAEGEDLVDEQGLPQMRKVTAKDSELRKQKELKDIKKKALFWKKIHQWDTAQARAYYSPGPIRPHDWEEAVFVRAQKDPFAIDLLMSNARGPVEWLLELARMGNVRAAKAAAELLEDFVRKLNLYAKANPEPFREAAREMTHWPVMHSPHPKLTQDPKMIAAQVQLGAGYPFHVVPEAEWDPTEFGCKVALSLFKYVSIVRRHPDHHRRFPFTDRVKTLPDIRESGAVSRWWFVAKQALLHGIPKPELDARFRSLATLKDRHKVRSKILERIEKRFVSLFPKSAR